MPYLPSLKSKLFRSSFMYKSKILFYKNTIMNYFGHRYPQNNLLECHGKVMKYHLHSKKCMQNYCNKNFKICIF